MTYEISITQEGGRVILDHQPVDPHTVMVVLSSMINKPVNKQTKKSKYVAKKPRVVTHECCGSKGSRHLKNCPAVVVSGSGNN